MNPAVSCYQPPEQPSHKTIEYVVIALESVVIAVLIFGFAVTFFWRQKEEENQYEGI